MASISAALGRARSTPFTSAPSTARGTTLMPRTAAMPVSCAAADCAILPSYTSRYLAKLQNCVKGMTAALPGGNTSGVSIRGADSGRYGAGAVHSDERLLHTRHYGIWLRPDLSAAAGPVAAPAFRDPTRTGARLHGIRSTRYHEQQEGQLERDQGSAAGRNDRRVHRCIRLA